MRIFNGTCEIVILFAERDCALCCTLCLVLAVLGHGGGRDHLTGRSFLRKKAPTMILPTRLDVRANARPRVPMRASARGARTNLTAYPCNE